MQIRSAALSDIGRVRRKNEDRILHDPEALLFGVADGVGGLPGGAEAAQLALDEIISALRELPGSEPPDLTLITQRASRRVHMLGAQLSPAFGIGTTLTFGRISGDVLHLAHVGDSRCYGWRRGELQQLTDDHSVENEARLRRARGEVVYYHEASRNALTRCIGQPTPPSVDLIERPLRAGDRYLFCTDGVTRIINNAELNTLIAQPGDPEKMLRDLVTLALKRGAPDNVTAVLLMIDSIE